jgi:hypothetical protein
MAGLDAMVRGIAGRVERATEGERNNVVFWAACRLSELVRAGRLDEDWSADLLEIVAVNAGLSRLEERRTIASGLRR